jgi:thiol-disulfide isomerase/thioredoxin
MIGIALTSKGDAQPNADGIRFFGGSWPEAMALARQEHKLIFIDCNTSWCGPCRELAATVFPQKAVGDYFNSHFINISMDMEKGEGPGMREAFHITGYPTLLFLKPEGGYEVNRLVGLTTADTLLMAARYAAGHTDSVGSKEAFDKGPRDSVFLRRYFTGMFQHGHYGDDVAAMDTIVRQEGPDAFYQRKYWDILAMARIGSPLMQWFLDHQDSLAALYGRQAVNCKIASMYLNRRVLEALRHFQRKDSSVFAGFERGLVERNPPGLPFIEGVLGFYQNCWLEQYDRAFEIADSALVDARPWQYRIMASWADWLLINWPSARLRASKWAARAAAGTKDAEDRQECLQIADDLMNGITPSYGILPSPKVYGSHI